VTSPSVLADPAVATATDVAIRAALVALMERVQRV